MNEIKKRLNYRLQNIKLCSECKHLSTASDLETVCLLLIKKGSDNIYVDWFGLCDGFEYKEHSDIKYYVDGTYCDEDDI